VRACVLRERCVRAWSGWSKGKGKGELVGGNQGGVWLCQ
jgi:hypothetical protein